MRVTLRSNSLLLTRRIHFFGILLFCLFSNLTTHALQSDVAITQYYHGIRRMNDGLPADIVRSVAQTNDGYLWVGTSAGLARFNGIGFKRMDMQNARELHSDSITALLKDRDGSLWIGTEDGLLNYDGKNFNVFTTYDGIPEDSIKALALDAENKLWILTSTNVSVFDRREFSSVPINAPLCIFADHAGVLVGTEKGLTAITGGKLTHYPADAVTAVYRNQKGETWVGVRNRGLCKLQDGNISPVLKTEEILSILQDRTGTIWIGTRLGIRHLSANSDLFPYINAAVTMMFEDREGILRAATSGQGLHSFRLPTIVSFGHDEGFNHPKAWCVLKDRDGSLWIGTEDGITRYKNRQFSDYLVPSPVKTVAEGPEGKIWIGTPSGVLRFDGRSFSMMIPDLITTSIVADKGGNLWMGAARGLWRWTKGAVQEISKTGITSLYIDADDKLYVGTTTGLQIWTNARLQNLFSSGPITCIRKDSSGVIWTGSYNGLQSNYNGRISNYKMGESNAISSILEDKNGYLWIGTSDGLFQVKTEKGKFLSNEIPVSDGLLTRQFAFGSPAAFQVDNEFWFATVDGLAKIDPYQSRVNRAPPPIVIEAMKVNRASVVDIHRNNLKFAGPVSRLEFEYAGLGYSSSMTYRYVLQGFDQYWSNAGGRRYAVYTNLPAGKYRFKVLAGDGRVWNIKGASLAFEIQSSNISGTNTGFFSLIAAGLVGFLVAWFFRSRISFIPSSRMKS